MSRNTEAAERRMPDRKKKRGRRMVSKVRILLTMALCLVLMAGSFGLGWAMGADSTKYYGEVLLVNSDNRLTEDYVPAELVNLYEQRHSFRLARSDIYLTRECYEAMERMFAAAEDVDMNGYTITSGYRDYQRQAEIYAESEPGYAQQPGASEHQTGLAFDVTVETNDGFENTPQYSWLMKNAHKYGFIQRYPANKVDETGISYEPWHYRYVGEEAAEIIYKKGMSLEAFVKANQ